MGIFGRRRDEAPAPARRVVPPPPPVDRPGRVPVVAGDVDWSDRANIAAEWKVDPGSIDQDMTAWRNGMRMALADEVPGQRFNEAEYMTRALKHHLGGDGPLADDDLASTIGRVLDLLDRVPEQIVTQMGMGAFMPQLARLALLLTRERHWQPPEFGGDGTVKVSPTSPIVNAALAFKGASEGDHVRHFFGTTN